MPEPVRDADRTELPQVYAIELAIPGNDSLSGRIPGWQPGAFRARFRVAPLVVAMTLAGAGVVMFPYHPVAMAVFCVAVMASSKLARWLMGRCPVCRFEKGISWLTGRLVWCPSCGDLLTDYGRRMIGSRGILPVDDLLNAGKDNAPGEVLGCLLAKLALESPATLHVELEGCEGRVWIVTSAEHLDLVQPLPDIVVWQLLQLISCVFADRPQERFPSRHRLKDVEYRGRNYHVFLKEQIFRTSVFSKVSEDHRRKWSVQLSLIPEATDGEDVAHR